MPKHVEVFVIINHNFCIKLVPLVIFIYDARSHIHQTLRNSAFSHTIYLCVPYIFVYSTDWLVLLTEMEFVLCDVRNCFVCNLDELQLSEGLIPIHSLRLSCPGRLIRIIFKKRRVWKREYSSFLLSINKSCKCGKLCKCGAHVSCICWNTWNISVFPHIPTTCR